MEQESLKENKTWRIVDSSEAKGKILSSKWIFKTKEDGRKKARLAVKGFEQIYGIDYEETFSPVVNNASLRILFALAVKKNYILTTFDIGRVHRRIETGTDEGTETGAFDSKMIVSSYHQTLFKLKLLTLKLKFQNRVARAMLEKWGHRPGDAPPHRRWASAAHRCHGIAAARYNSREYLRVSAKLLQHSLPLSIHGQPFELILSLFLLLTRYLFIGSSLYLWT